MSGPDRLKAALAALPAALALGIGTGLAAVATAAADEARRRLPPGALADSLAVRADGGSTGAALEVASPHAIVVEYGTTHMPARPFLRPAAEAASADAGPILAEAFDHAVRAALDDCP